MADNTTTNEAPDTKVPPQEPADDNKPEPGKPPALFEEGSGYSFFGNLMGLLRTNSAGDAGNATDTRAAPSDAPVELPADFPQHYLGFCKGDQRKALDLYNTGLAVRKELGLDDVLNGPYAHYEQLSAHYPIQLHARSKAGEVLLVQAPGKLDVGKVKAAGFTRADVLRYFMYHLEFLKQRIDPNAKVLMVIDMQDLGMLKLMNGDMLQTIRDISTALSSVYCRTVSRYVVTNPPSIFNALWNILVTVLPAGAADNMTVCKDAAALEAFLEQRLIPAEFGGSLPLGHAEEHKQLKAHLASKQ